MLTPTLRSITRRPGFSAIVIATLALGIGGNVILYSVVSGVLWAPLPFSEPEALSIIWEHNVPRERRYNVVSPATYLAWQEHSRVYAELAAMSPGKVTLTGEHEPVRLDSAKVTEGFFSLLGVEPLLGRASVARERFSAIVLGLFALLALAIASLGVYGVVGFFVSQRNREMGLRLALGATRHDIVSTVMARGLWMTFSGLALGILGAALTTRLLTSLLFGVSPLDPMTLAAVCLVLIAAALVACYLPARRASRIDPVHALRSD